MCRKVVFVAVAASLGIPASYAEDLKIRHPNIEYGEFEIDHNSTITFDRSKSDRNNNQTHSTEFEYGALEWWKPGFEIATQAGAGENLHLDAFAFENYFQLTPQGKYWADLSMFAEIEQPVKRGDPRAFTIGPLVQKELPGLFLGATRCIR